jgi:hypothetical protein
MANDGTSLYAGTLNTGILKSADQGETWTALNPAMGNVPIRCMVMNGNYIFAGTSNYYEDPLVQPVGIYRSGDNGATWTLVNNGLSNLDIGSMVASGTDLYAGTKSGIYKSTNNGDSWTAVNQGFVTPPHVTSLAVSGNYLFSNNWNISTGDPVFRRALSGNPPLTPGAVSGSAAPCIGSSLTYSVPNVSGVTYAWQFPTGWVITGGATTNAVTVTVGNTMGVVLVTATNGWGSSPAQYMIVMPNSNPPAQPGVISGPVAPLEGTLVTYSVVDDPGVSYGWSFPSGWVQSSGGTTHSVIVSVGYGSGNVQVIPSTPCGSGSARMLAVTVSPANLTVSGVVVSTGQVRCYGATGTIVVAGNGSTFGVQPGGEATFIAGQKISFLPGTTVEPGGNLVGMITTSGQYCDSPTPGAQVALETASSPADASSPSFYLYPNPTSGRFTVEQADGQSSSEMTIEIFGMTGRTFEPEVIDADHATFSLGSAPAGLYLIRIMAGDKAVSCKLIKQ